MNGSLASIGTWFHRRWRVAIACLLLPVVGLTYLLGRNSTETIRDYGEYRDGCALTAGFVVRPNGDFTAAYVFVSSSGSRNLRVETTPENGIVTIRVNGDTVRDSTAGDPLLISNKDGAQASFSVESVTAERLAAMYREMVAGKYFERVCKANTSGSEEGPSRSEAAQQRR